MINSVEAVLQARKVYHDLHQAYNYDKVAKVLEDWLTENKALAYESSVALKELYWLYGLSDDENLQQIHEVIERDNLGIDIEDIRVKPEPIPSDEKITPADFSYDFSLLGANVPNPEPFNDPVNHPNHYMLAKGIEAIDLMEMTSTAPEFCGHLRNTALKYIIRAGKKDPRKYIEDLEKAKWYISKLQEYYSKCENNEY